MRNRLQYRANVTQPLTSLSQGNQGTRIRESLLKGKDPYS
jgi:hypothetical protein